MAALKKTIGVVIVSYNSAGDLKKCLESVNKAVNEAGLGEVTVVVDNHSHDKSVEIAKTNGANVIINFKNLGFAAAVNQGTRKCFAKGADYILILNPDLIVGRDAISQMISLLDSDKKIGAVGPSTVDRQGRSTADDYYLKAPTWLSVALFSTFLRPRVLKSEWLVRALYRTTPLKQSRQVEQIPGACLLTSRSVLNQVGLLDEDYAIWYEDVDWCFRARQKGYQLWYCAKAVVEHEGGKSFNQWQSLDKAVTFYVSMKTFFNKHKPISGWLVRIVLVLNSLALFIKNRDRSNLVFIKRFLTESRGKLPN